VIDYLGFLTTAAEQWTVDSGQWSVVGCQLSAGKPRTANHEPPPNSPPG